jgi:peptide methionine sulfoxide reductase MsrA
VQDLLRRYPGVIATRVGYTGGEVANATYRNHGNHAEGVEIIFDPKLISYRQLLEFFFQIHVVARPRHGTGTTHGLYHCSEQTYVSVRRIGAYAEPKRVVYHNNRSGEDGTEPTEVAYGVQD